MKLREGYIFLGPHTLACSPDIPANTIRKAQCGCTTDGHYSVDFIQTEVAYTNDLYSDNTPDTAYCPECKQLYWGFVNKTPKNYKKLLRKGNSK